MCLYCRRTGHFRRTCPELNAFCSNCKRKGHQTVMCSYAKRMNALSKTQVNQDEFEPEGLVTNATEAKPRTASGQANQDQGKRTRDAKSNESTPERLREAKNQRIDEEESDTNSSDNETSTGTPPLSEVDEANEEDLRQTAAGPTSGYSAADEEEATMNMSSKEEEPSLDRMIGDMKAATTAAGKPKSTTNQKNKESAPKNPKGSKVKSNVARQNHQSTTRVRPNKPETMTH
jgi:hypothetical protein